MIITRQCEIARALSGPGWLAFGTESDWLCEMVMQSCGQLMAGGLLSLLVVTTSGAGPAVAPTGLLCALMSGWMRQDAWWP